MPAKGGYDLALSLHDLCTTFSAGVMLGVLIIFLVTCLLATMTPQVGTITDAMGRRHLGYQMLILRTSGHDSKSRCSHCVKGSYRFHGIRWMAVRIVDRQMPWKWLLVGRGSLVLTVMMARLF